jgi:hypothetical protein
LISTQLHIQYAINSIAACACCMQILATIYSKNGLFSWFEISMPFSHRPSRQG